MTLPRYALTEKGDYVPPTTHAFSSIYPTADETEKGDPMGVSFFSNNVVLHDKDKDDPMGVDVLSQPTFSSHKNLVLHKNLVSSGLIGPDTFSHNLASSSLDLVSSSSAVSLDGSSSLDLASSSSSAVSLDDSSLGQ